MRPDPRCELEDNGKAFFMLMAHALREKQLMERKSSEMSAAGLRRHPGRVVKRVSDPLGGLARPLQGIATHNLLWESLWTLFIL
jgi:hypothetical protein